MVAWVSVGVAVYLGLISFLANFYHSVTGFGDAIVLHVLWRIAASIAPDAFHSTALGDDDLYTVVLLTYVRGFALQLLSTGLYLASQYWQNRRRADAGRPVVKSSFSLSFMLLLMFPALVGAYIGVETLDKVNDSFLRIVLGASSFFFALTLMSLHMSRHIETRRIQDIISEDLTNMRNSQLLRHQREAADREEAARLRDRAQRRRLALQERYEQWLLTRQERERDGDAGQRRCQAALTLSRGAAVGDDARLAADDATDDAAGDAGRLPDSSAAEHRHDFDAANGLDAYIRVRLGEISVEGLDSASPRTSAVVATTLQALRDLDAGTAPSSSVQGSRAWRRRRQHRRVTRSLAGSDDVSNDTGGDGDDGSDDSGENEEDFGAALQSHATASSIVTDSSKQEYNKYISNSNKNNKNNNIAIGSGAACGEASHSLYPHSGAAADFSRRSSAAAAWAVRPMSAQDVQAARAAERHAKKHHHHHGSQQHPHATSAFSSAEEVNLGLREVQQLQLEALQREANRKKKRRQRIRFIRVDGAVLSGAIVSSLVAGVLASYTGVGVPAQMVFVLAMNISGSLFKANVSISSLLPSALRLGLGIGEGHFNSGAIGFYLTTVLCGAAGMVLGEFVGLRVDTHAFYLSVIVTLLLAAAAMTTTNAIVLILALVAAGAALLHIIRRQSVTTEHAVPAPPPNTPTTAAEIRNFRDQWDDIYDAFQHSINNKNNNSRRRGGGVGSYGGHELVGDGEAAPYPLLTGGAMQAAGASTSTTTTITTATTATTATATYPSKHLSSLRTTDRSDEGALSMPSASLRSAMAGANNNNNNNSTTTTTNGFGFSASSSSPRRPKNVVFADGVKPAAAAGHSGAGAAPQMEEPRRLAADDDDDDEDEMLMIVVPVGDNPADM